MATNRGVTNVRGTEFSSPHGIPVDLLDRLMIIRYKISLSRQSNRNYSTMEYTVEDIQQILGVRARVEGLQHDEASIAALAEVGARTSLRYAIQLLTPASIVSNLNGTIFQILSRC